MALVAVVVLTTTGFRIRETGFRTGELVKNGVASDAGAVVGVKVEAPVLVVLAPTVIVPIVAVVVTVVVGVLVVEL